MNLYYEEHNGSTYRTTSTQFVVNRWYVPGGYMYDQARPVDIFFDKEDDANAYAKEWEMPPEMAGVITIAFYDNVTLSCCKSYKDYKKRFWSDFDRQDRPVEIRKLFGWDDE